MKPQSDHANSFSLDELVINSNKEFVKCDKKDCEERGSYPRCYFDIYVNCDLYTSEQ